MPLKIGKNEQTKLNVWIIHTNRPFYKIMRAELDPDTKELMDAKKKGSKVLESTPLAAPFKNKYLAAESLEFSPERSENMTWALADEHGDFILEDGEEARQVWEMVKKDPEPKPFLDPRSPSIPAAPEFKK